MSLNFVDCQQNILTFKHIDLIRVIFGFVAGIHMYFTLFKKFHAFSL